MVAILAAGSTIVGLLAVLDPATDTDMGLDEFLCPMDGTASAQATYLIDARKPLDVDLRPLPSRLLEDVTLDIATGTALEVYAISDDAAVPRRPLGRICKPYDNADLQVSSAKDQTVGIRDCHDLPAQLPQRVRDLASRFCVVRDELQDRIDQLPIPGNGDAVTNAYVVEAVDAILREHGEGKLYIFSDLLQHGGWFSHLDVDHTGQGFDDFVLAYEDFAGQPRPPSRPELDIVVFYLPRTGLTDESGAELAHKRFWRAYFGEADVTFKNQPPSLNYTIRASAAAPTEAQLARKRARLAREREDAERLLAEIRAQQTELAEEEQAPAQTERHQAELLEHTVDAEELQQDGDDLQATPVPPAATPPPAPVVPTATGPGASATARGGHVTSVPEPEVPAVLEPEPGVPTVPEPEPEVPTVSEPEPKVPTVSEPEPKVPTVPEPEPVVPTVPDAVPVQPQPTEIVRCELRRARSEQDTANPVYPSDTNIGTAVIVVNFRVMDDGSTLDESVVFDRSRSRADRRWHLDRFRRAAIRAVRQWEFEPPTDGSCQMRQESAVPIEFRYQ